MNTTSRMPEPVSFYSGDTYYLNNNSKERTKKKKNKKQITNSVKIANILHLLFYHYIRSFPSFRLFHFVSFHFVWLGYILFVIAPHQMCVSYCTYTKFSHTISYRTLQNHIYNHMQNAHYGGIHCVPHFRHINIFQVLNT